MTRTDGEVIDPHPDATEDNEVIRRLIKDITSGKHWYLALLEAINLWDITEEIHGDRTYQYLISGEAFDWLLLAERLCRAIDVFVPEPEKTALLFNGEIQNLTQVFKWHDQLLFKDPINSFKDLISCSTR